MWMIIVKDIIFINYQTKTVVLNPQKKGWKPFKGHLNKTSYRRSDCITEIFKT